MKSFKLGRNLGNLLYRDYLAHGHEDLVSKSQVGWRWASGLPSLSVSAPYARAPWSNVADCRRQTDLA